MPLEITFMYVTKIVKFLLKILVIFTIQKGSQSGSKEIRKYNIIRLLSHREVGIVIFYVEFLISKNFVNK